MGRLLVFLVALPVIACDAVYIPPCAMGAWSDQTFIGTVVEVRAGEAKFVFRIDEPFKGIAPGTKEIEVGPGACGSGYQPGAQYLILPGVPDRASAGVVSIAGPETIQGLDFTIGPRKATRPIVVSVEWPDGRPVINASVTCVSSSPRSAGSAVDFVLRYVDMSGEATCEVLAEEGFTVEADRLTWKGSDRPVQPVATRPKLTVAPGSDPVHLKLVIDAVNDLSSTQAPMNMSSFNDKDF